MATRENADPAMPQTPVGTDSISARFVAARGSAGGFSGLRAAAARRLASETRLRAGCPHPAGPCGGARFRFWNRQGAAGVNARPTGRGKYGGQPGKRGGRPGRAAKTGLAKSIHLLGQVRPVVFHFAADGISEPTGDRPAPALDKAMRQAYHQKRGESPVPAKMRQRRRVCFNR